METIVFKDDGSDATYNDTLNNSFLEIGFSWPTVIFHEFFAN